MVDATDPISDEQKLKRRLEKKVINNDWRHITLDELMWYWTNQFYSTIGQATLHQLERLKDLENEK